LRPRRKAGRPVPADAQPFAVAAEDRDPVPTNNCVRIVKTLAIFQHRLRLSHEAASAVTRAVRERTDVCAARNGKSGRGVARLRCAPLAAVVQAADLWNSDHAPRSQRRDRTWYGCILVQPEVRSCSRVVDARADGAWRRIAVRLQRPNLQARTRAGYYAAPP
jgi:hypothetical protein